MGDEPHLDLDLGAQPGEIVSEKELMQRLGISRTTLWRLRASGLPSLNVGRTVRYDANAVRRWLEHSHPTLGATKTTGAGASGAEPVREERRLSACHWRPSVALDPKHRPQTPHRPSSTVRREWWWYPQEAHLLDRRGKRYRRLLASEIGLLQDFPAGWAKALDELDQIRGYGNAVPPGLARAVLREVGTSVGTSMNTSAEICAGFGGIALAAHQALGVRQLALVEIWDVACRVLRSQGVWPADVVAETDVRTFDWDSIRDQVDLLTGGPPCQPWSQGGLRRGAEDERDLLGETPDIVRRLRPSAFVFENVPGLLTGEHQAYGRWIVEQLRAPGDGLRYGVAIGTFNAADFGVPQVRRRIFIVGLRDRDTWDVHEVFDRIAARRTHADPRRLIPEGRSPWRTVGQAIPDWAAVEEGWRQWITAEQIESAARAALAADQVVFGASRTSRQRSRK